MHPAPLPPAGPRQKQPIKGHRRVEAAPCLNKCQPEGQASELTSTGALLGAVVMETGGPHLSALLLPCSTQRVPFVSFNSLKQLPPQHRKLNLSLKG